MKHLVQMITEGDIDRCERKYREFVKMCKSYDPEVNMKEVWVKKSVKNNWVVYHGLKKLFVTSFSVLDDDVIKKNNIKIVTESEEIEEASKNKKSKLIGPDAEEYEVAFIQYDPDVQADYEDGDVDEDELHDSAIEADYDRVPLKSTEDKKAVREAELIIKKMVNKHPELCGGIVYDRRGGIIENIFI